MCRGSPCAGPRWFAALLALVAMITVVAASTMTALKIKNLAVFDTGTTPWESWLIAAHAPGQHLARQLNRNGHQPSDHKAPEHETRLSSISTGARPRVLPTSPEALRLLHHHWSQFPGPGQFT